MLLYGTLRIQYGLKKHLLEPRSHKEVTHLNRVLRGVQGIGWEWDPKHMSGKESMRWLSAGGCRLPSRRIVGRSRVREIHWDQDRPDSAATARALSQRMAAPTEGTEMCLKRVIRHLASHPRGVLMLRRGWAGETCTAAIGPRIWRRRKELA